MKKFCTLIALALVVAVGAVGAASAATRQIRKKASITPPAFFFTQQADSSVKNAVARGKRLFRSIGCVGCHPRGRTVGGTAVDVMGNRNPVPIPSLIGAAEHFPRLSPAGQVVSVGQFNDLCAAVFIGADPMDPYSQKYKDLETYVTSLSPKQYKRMLNWEKKRKAFMKKMRTTTIGKKRNPCGGNPCGGNPCAAKNPCAKRNPCNPCAAKNPCAKRNPCNPCARK